MLSVMYKLTHRIHNFLNNNTHIYKNFKVLLFFDTLLCLYTKINTFHITSFYKHPQCRGINKIEDEF